MSYGASSALQTAVYDALINDTAVAAQVGTAVFDAVPSGTPPALFILLGDEEVRDRSDATAAGSLHDFTLSVVGDVAGFRAVKQAAGAVSDALLNAELTLQRGQMVSMVFLRARARRVGTGNARRVDLRFRAQIEDTP